MSHDWPFLDSEETEVITLSRILNGKAPLRLVTHDSDDDGWQFLDGEHIFEADAAMVMLAEIVRFDLSLRTLADLPVGWYAWRSSPDQPWQRQPGEPPADIVDSGPSGSSTP